jgi:hypothetical protein
LARKEPDGASIAFRQDGVPVTTRAHLDAVTSLPPASGDGHRSTPPSVRLVRVMMVCTMVVVLLDLFLLASAGRPH